MNDREIRRAIESDPEARPTDAEFWRAARVVMPVAKQTITIRLDADLLQWLRKEKALRTPEEDKLKHVPPCPSSTCKHRWDML